MGAGAAGGTGAAGGGGRTLVGAQAGVGTRTRGGAQAGVGARTRSGGRTPGGARSGVGAQARGGVRGRARAWAELLRVSALASVPGDTLAGAAAAGTRPGHGTAWAVGASLCLYEAGMALNDWADRAEDAADRPHRPLPSGRIAPRQALAAATLLTGAGLLCAARAGRAPLAVAGMLAGTVWAYDLRLKHTPAGPAAMAAARTLDLLLGATAATHLGGVASALPSAAALGLHTYAVTAVSRHEAHGGSTAAPLAALATGTALATWAARPARPRRTADGAAPPAAPPSRPAAVLAAAAYLRTAGVPFLHAALNPSAPLTRRAVGGGIRAMIPLQATLAARAGAPVTAAALLAVTPLARALARKVSPT
ncbi:SCO3242 family prenyltransferase [Streptomyces sp. ODS05-4]|uniref:SCO3242 family prenyltransferase n=1 Tax=Streptomyces sp. ODS05-4 TaxID=2944939 RepID=UPI0035AE723B